MDAKCPKCDKVATLDDEATNVKCPHCGFEAKYEDYLDMMREKVGQLAENFQFERRGF
ncbi:MAG TPA: zinc-domain-containing protein [Candidatus Nitrosotalea sp.]|nr:zinc-domain-containing protein [Candidatus Nitrosotalea sp.]